MKNQLTDLNNYMFEMIERLFDDSLDDEQLNKEIKRSDAIQKMANTIIQNGNLALNAKKHMDEYGAGDDIEIPVLGITNKSK